MNENEALAKMVAPGTVRPGKPRGGVIQILVTSSCDLACTNCTQASNLRRRHWVMTPEQFETAVDSLHGYFGTVGVFGGNPTLSKYFDIYCNILRERVPKERCGLWSNNLHGHGRICRETFNPAVSNLNVHLVEEAYNEMRRDWPEARPFGLKEDSRHSPGWVAMKDVVEDEGQRWDLISNCDINRHWSAMIGVFRGELRAWFCEIAGAQSILHQYDPHYPDTGLPVLPGWWQKPMQDFADQVRKHCHECGVPLRGYGALARDPNGIEQVSATHEDVYEPKKRSYRLEVVSHLDELKAGRIGRFTDYLQNAKK